MAKLISIFEKHLDTSCILHALWKQSMAMVLEISCHSGEPNFAKI